MGFHGLLIGSHWPVLSHGIVYFPKDSRGKSSETFSIFCVRAKGSRH